MQAAKPPRIDLISDTVTQPTPGMLQAMVHAELGDEQRGEDPTTNRLCHRVATLLGKESALFLPSGVMCNQISVLVHCQPGDEIFADRSAHIINSEAGGPAALAGATIRALDGDHGIFTAAQVEERLTPRKRNGLRPRLVVVEQTVNRGGGIIWPIQHLNELAALARDRSLSLHMDGARLLNAAVASGVPAKDYAQCVDTVWIDFSKGLGCPIGAVLAGSADLIERAWVWKHRLGGAMRQSGILAAAGLYALDHHVDRLAHDHSNASRLAAGLAALPGIRLDPATVQTNLVFLDVRDTGRSAYDICASLRQQGIRLGAESPSRIRAVTHLGITRDDVDETTRVFEEILGRPI